MTALRLRYVQRWVDTRHGGVVIRHRFRRPGFKPMTLPGLPGTAPFMDAYNAAMKGDTAPPVVIGLERSPRGSVADLVASFKVSAEYLATVASTRSSYNSVLEGIRTEHGDKPAARVGKEHVDAMFAKKVAAHSVGYANKWLRMMRRLFEIAIDKGIRADNPAIRVKAIKQKRSDVEDGYHTWTEDEVAIYRAAYALGTKARLAMELMLCTASRRSDAVTLGRQYESIVTHKGRRIRMIKVRQQKTGKWVSIPMHPDLAAAIDAMPAVVTPVKCLHYLITERGRPMAKKTLGNKMAAWCTAIGLDKECRSHGLRKACARRLAEVGCSEKQIAAITGHTDMRVLALYVRMADDAKLAIGAMDKLVAAMEAAEATLVPEAGANADAMAVSA